MKSCLCGYLHKKPAPATDVQPHSPEKWSENQTKHQTKCFLTVSMCTGTARWEDTAGIPVSSGLTVGGYLPKVKWGCLNPL